MELEQRVKALEYEIKILKNELQRTLLDIHEQILLHYYPALRSDETKPPASVMQAIEALRTKQANPTVEAAASVVQTVELGRTKPAPAGAEPPMPVVRKVSLDEVRAAHYPAAAAAATVDQASALKLFEWAINSAAKVGSKRASRIVEVFDARGLMAPEMKEVLLRITAFNKATAPEKVAAHELVDEILKLDVLLGRAADPQEARALIEEANLG